MLGPGSSVVEALELGGWDVADSLWSRRWLNQSM